MRDYEYLIHLIYSFLSGEAPLEKPDEVSFENVFAIGKAHEVANIAFLSVDKLKVKPDDALYNEWKINYFFSVERDMHQWEDRDYIVSALHKKGIRTLEAQGTVTKRLYPETYPRMMTDIDIIIDRENIDAAVVTLEENSYAVTRQQELEFFAKCENKTELDFHTDFFTEYMYNRRESYHDAMKSPFEHACESETEKLSYFLDDVHFCLYTILHTIKHFETAGCGIRRILDLYYLKKKYENTVDNAFIKRVVDENGLREHYDKLFALEALWFENKECSLDLTETVRDVVTSGNHGSLDIFTRNNVRKDIESGVRFAKLKRIISFLFPDKEYIYNEYPECKERGYSTAVSRIYRLLRKIKNMSFSHALKHIKQIIKTK